VLDAGGTVTNSKSIEAKGANTNGIALNAGGAVTNYGSGTVYGETGVWDGAAAATVTNEGTITGNEGDGIQLEAGGIVNNYAGAKIGSQSHVGLGIYGGIGTVTNAGSIQSYAAAHSAIYFGAGGSVSNSGTIGGGLNGVSVGAGAATVTNSGAITGTSLDGAKLSGGGTVTNQSGGTITGDDFGVYIAGAAGSVTNAGTISGGTASVEFAGAGANTLTLETGSSLTGNVLGSTASGATNALTLEGSGSASIDFLNFNTLDVASSANWTLSSDSTIGASTIAGDLTVTGELDTAFSIAVGGVLELLGGGGSVEASSSLANKGTLDIGNGSQAAPDIVSAASLTNSGTIELTGNGAEGAALTLTGALTNKGAITLTNDAEELGGAVSGTGSFTLDGTSTLEFDSSVAATQTITLDGTDEIALKEAQDFHALIAGFGAGGAKDSIDAMDFSRGSSTFTFSENAGHTMATLTLTNGAEVAHFHLSGDYVRSDFKLASDAAGTGTLIKFV
jgi:hypothetical protein